MRVPAAPRLRGDAKPLVGLSRATELRDNRRLAGIDRPQLFEHDGRRRHIVVHDLRATFVTVHLAMGKSEAWITDPTGPAPGEMIYPYKRAARSYEELGLGPLVPALRSHPRAA